MVNFLFLYLLLSNVANPKTLDNYELVLSVPFLSTPYHYHVKRVVIFNFRNELCCVLISKKLETHYVVFYEQKIGSALRCVLGAKNWKRITLCFMSKKLETYYVVFYEQKIGNALCCVNVSKTSGSIFCCQFLNASCYFILLQAS